MGNETVKLVILEESPAELVIHEQEAPKVVIGLGFPVGNSGGGAGGFPYSRNGVPAAEWIIEHNLSRKPSVTVVLDSGEQVFADVFYTSTNTLTVTFAEPQTGEAWLI